MYRKRDREKMGLRSSQRELEEKIRKSDNDPELVETLLKQMTVMSDQLNKLNKNVEDLKNKEQVVVTVPTGSGTEKLKSEQINDKVFIPSVDTEGLKVSASKVETRNKKIDLSDSVEELKKMEKTNGH